MIKLTNIKILEKKPIKGGTPAKDKKIIVKELIKKKFNFKSLNEYIVLKLKLMNCCKIQKIIKIDIL